MSIDEVVDRQDRMPEEHPGTGIAHDLFDLFSDIGTVTVDRATIAHRLVSFEWASSESGDHISVQSFALVTESRSRRIVVPTAEKGDHLDHR